MVAATVMQALQDLFYVYCMFYFTCDRSFIATDRCSCSDTSFTLQHQRRNGFCNSCRKKAAAATQKLTTLACLWPIFLMTLTYKYFL